MAQREGWRVVAEFSDENRSAYHGSRGEGLQQAKAKAEATKDGIERAVRRGEWRGSPPPEGYEIFKAIVDGEVVRKMVKRAADADKFELIWRLAEEGRSALKISLELDRRGYTTRPSR